MSYVPVPSGTPWKGQPGGGVVDNSRWQSRRVGAAKNSKNAKGGKTLFAFFEFFAAITTVWIHAIAEESRPAIRQATGSSETCPTPNRSISIVFTALGRGSCRAACARHRPPSLAAPKERRPPDSLPPIKLTHTPFPCVCVPVVGSGFAHQTHRNPTTKGTKYTKRQGVVTVNVSGSGVSHPFCEAVGRLSSVFLFVCFVTFVVPLRGFGSFDPEHRRGDAHTFSVSHKQTH